MWVYGFRACNFKRIIMLLVVQLQAPKSLQVPGTGSKVKESSDNPEDPSIHIIPTLGPKVCKYYLHSAMWILRVIA